MLQIGVSAIDTSGVSYSRVRVLPKGVLRSVHAIG